MESYCGTPAQSLSGGNPEAEITHGPITSVHKVVLQKYNLDCKTDMEGKRWSVQINSISKSGQQGIICLI